MNHLRFTERPRDRQANAATDRGRDGAERNAHARSTPRRAGAAAPAMNDVIGGHINFMFAALSIVKGNVQPGKLRMIGVGSDHRSREFPDVPTISESGVPGFEAKSWFGLVAPAGTPADIIRKINKDVPKWLSDQAFADKYLAAQGREPIVSSPEQFVTFIRDETVKWGKVVKDANIKITK